MIRLVDLICDLAAKDDGKGLEESMVVEALNLKAAVFMRSRQLEAARQVLDQVPVDDPVTVHNRVLCTERVEDSLESLAGLLDGENCPPETGLNMFSIAVKNRFYSLAREIMALGLKCLSEQDKELITLLMDDKVEKVECVHRLYQLKDQVDLERYAAIVIHMASQLWSMSESFEAIEELTAEALQVIGSHPEIDTRPIRITHAHSVYMQGRLDEAIKLYEPFKDD